MVASSWQVDYFNVLRGVSESPNNQIVVIKAPRQVFKSSSMVLSAVYCIQHHRNWCVGYCMPSWAQCQKQFNLIKDLCNDGARGMRMLKLNSSDLTIYDPRFNSRIQFITAGSAENLRGATFHMLYLDEAAYLPSSVIDLLMPTRLVNKAPLIVGSTPLRKKGRFWEFYNDPKAIVLDWCKYDLSEILSDDVLEFFKARLSSALYQTDYLGEFLDSGLSLLFGDLSKSTISEQPSYKKLYVGIDCGYGSDKDYTSIVALNEYGQEVYVEHLNRGGISAQEGAIYQFLLSHKDVIQSVKFESNALGEPMLEHIKKMLRESGNHTLCNRIKGDYWTSSTKAKAFTDLIAGFGTGVVKVLNIGFHLDELSNYAMRVSSTGVISYGNMTASEADDEGLDGGSAHDDSVCALAHAYSAYLSGAVAGKYILG